MKFINKKSKKNESHIEVTPKVWTKNVWGHFIIDTSIKIIPINLNNH